MVEFSDNVQLSLLFGIALTLLITVSVLAANDNNNDDNEIGLETSFCENFTISDDGVRQIFADSIGNSGMFVSRSNLRCLPEQVFDKVSDEDIETIEANAEFSISISAPLVAVHPDAFKTDLDLRKVTSVSLNDLPDGNVIETGDNFLSSFTNLLEVILRTASTSISDTLVGDVTTIRNIDIAENENLESLPTFISNQLFLQDLNFQRTEIDEVQEGLLSGLERLRTFSVVLFDIPLIDSSLTESDVADLYGTDKDHLTSFDFENDHCILNDQSIRRDIKDNIHFDIETDTTVIDLITICFPNDLFREFSDEELFSLFPQDKDTSLLITSPIALIPSTVENVFNGPEGLFNRVTSVTFQGAGFFTLTTENMFQQFTALEEVIFREIEKDRLENQLISDLIGEPCRRVTKTFRFLNSLRFTSFPRILTFCPSIETLDFTGCEDFLGEDAELLIGLQSLSELVLTNTGIAIEQDGNVAAIAGILQVPEEIIVIN